VVVKLHRYRYLKLEIYGNELSLKLLIQTLRKKYSLVFGEIALAKSALHVLQLTSNNFIIRVTHLHRNQIEAVVQLIGDNTYIPVIRRVSGTIKGITKKTEEQNIIMNIFGEEEE